MTQADNRIEHEALLLCARTELKSQSAARLRNLMAEQFDWVYFYKMARRHSLIPLVYSQLERSVRELVPPDILGRFRKDYQENAARNLVLTNELTRLVKDSAAAGIEMIAFKGPALAMFAYDNLALRRFIDLDLMVRRADVMGAIRVLKGRGYSTARRIEISQQELLLRTQHNLQFIREKLIVELHWQVSAELFAASVTAEELWDRLITIDLNGSEVKTLSVDDLLFSLCVHGSRHLWQRLAWICDVAQIVPRHDIDWRQLLTRAKQTRAERMFLLGFRLATDLFDAQLPELITAAINSDKRIASLAAEIIQTLFDSDEQKPASSPAIFRYNFLVRKDWRSRARYFLFALTPTDSDVVAVKLSRRLRFAYYLVRPFRLLVSKRNRKDLKI